MAIHFGLGIIGVDNRYLTFQNKKEPTQGYISIGWLFNALRF